jgi:hypothetical protein
MLEEFEIEMFCEALRLGASLEVAARSVGLVPAEVIGYMQAGRNPDSPFAPFRSKVAEAIALSEVKALERINKAADWRAQAWILSRRFPKRWGDNLAVDVSVGVKQTGASPWAATLKRPEVGLMLGANNQPAVIANPSDETEGSSTVIEGEILED